jgi:REP element-mobilizing transposase RayT
MTNHFHLVVEPPEPNLSRGMQWLMGAYAMGSIAATGGAVICFRAASTRF